MLPAYFTADRGFRGWSGEVDPQQPTARDQSQTFQDLGLHPGSAFSTVGSPSGGVYLRVLTPVLTNVPRGIGREDDPRVLYASLWAIGRLVHGRPRSS